jgi:hypothetical protein
MDATEISVDGGAEAGSAVDISTDDSFAPRLAEIENQPLGERASAYTELHDQLRARLEGGDVPVAAHR